MKKFVIHIEPIGKPRMTQRDKWKKRPCVNKYYEFKDELVFQLKSQGYIETMPFNSLSWVAYISMPKSWSKKKKDLYRGMLHMQKPDRDNIDKCIMDCIPSNMDDKSVATGVLTKRWDDGLGARLELTFDFVRDEVEVEL